MQLEKATSHFGEAGSAGWITSTGVMLFAVVLAAVAVMFLHTGLVERTEMTAELEGEKLSLANQNRRIQEDMRRVSEELAAVNAEFADARNMLESTRRERQSLEEIRTQLDAELAAKKQELQQRTDEWAELSAAKARIEAQRVQLLDDKDAREAKFSQVTSRFEAELAELAAQLQQRQQERDELQASRDEFQKERDRLEQQAKTLTEQVAKLEQQIDAREKSLADLRQATDAKTQSLEQQLAQALKRPSLESAPTAQQLQAAIARAEQAKAQVREVTATRDDYLDRLWRAAAYVRDVDEKKNALALQVDALKTQLADALNDLRTAQLQIQQQRSGDPRIHRGLVGLRGNLKRVALLFDASARMTHDGHWDKAQQLAQTWLEHLDVEECVLVVFSSQARVFPADGSLLSISGPDGADNRARLLQSLQAVQPAGWTNTRSAMQLAYQHRIDSIILFSNGAPTYENANRINKEAVERVFALCRQHADIPINVVALGNYFDPEVGAFLRTITQLTGGAFLGR